MTKFVVCTVGGFLWGMLLGQLWAKGIVDVVAAAGALILGSALIGLAANFLWPEL